MPKKTLLLVEDDPRFAELVRYVLTQDVPDFDIEHAPRLSAALAVLARRDIAVVVSDLNLPDSQGADTVRHLLRAAPNTPLIVMTSNHGFDLALECIQEGADEFVAKGTVGLHAMGEVIRLAIERHRRLQQRSGRPDLADGGLEDRSTFESVARYLLGVADRAGLHIAVIILRVEPRAGQAQPDAARIAAVTAVLRRTVRHCDVVARLDPWELAVVLVMGQPDSDEAAARLAQELAVAVGDPPVQLGIAMYHSGGTETLHELLGQAHNRLHPVRT